MTVRINRQLNLVFPVERDDGKIYIHATPIGREVFETYFEVIAQTFNAIYREQVEIAGPGIAALMLRKLAQRQGVWEGPLGVANGLMNEIRRLANVLAPASSGWELTPLHDAVAKGLITQDDMAEVEAALVFFTCLSCVHRKSNLLAQLGVMLNWGCEIVSLSCTEFRSSLPTLTEAANSGATTAAS